MTNNEIRIKIAELKGCKSPELRIALADQHIGNVLDYPIGSYERIENETKKGNEEIRYQGD